MSEPGTGKILIVNNNKRLLNAARSILFHHFNQIDTEKSTGGMLKRLRHQTYDVILLDINLIEGTTGKEEGRLWINNVLRIDPAAVVVLITAGSEAQHALNLIKSGAADFVIKPWENEKLLATVLACTRLRQLIEQVEILKRKNQEINDSLNEGYREIVGQSQAMRRVFQRVERAAQTDANVLILGESGTGKELVARAIHARSARQHETFAKINLGSFSEKKFDRQLLGRRPTAASDASESRPGRFELANGGTLFLNEIGALPLSLQAKLLTALSSPTLNATSRSKKTPLNLRVMSATDQPLHQLVKTNRFLPDLLHRLNAIEIEIPPLRSRVEDIPLLARHFLNFYNQKYGKRIKKISNSSLSLMARHPWPGNVRELQHTIERAVILTNSDLLLPEDFTFSVPAIRDANGAITLAQYHLGDTENLLVREALQKNNGNMTRTAAELGLTRRTLYRRVAKHNLLENLSALRQKPN